MNLPIPKICKQVQPLISFPSAADLPRGHHLLHLQNDKVVVVMGATGTGKSRLAIDLGTRFPAEIINCDKIQIYKGLDIVTNKVTEDECRGVPHHLIGIIDDPDTDFTESDFARHASSAIESILSRGRVPILAGGSNSFIEAFLNQNKNIYLRSRYVFCLVWVDVDLPVLTQFLLGRVDHMMENGFVEEVADLFHPDADYSRGLRRAIGVPELDMFNRSQGKLEDAIEEIKSNTCHLARRQINKIRHLRNYQRWPLHRIDATEAFRKKGEESDMAWDRLVVGPATMIVGRFLQDEGVVVNKVKSRGKHVISRTATPSSPTHVVAAAAMASS